MIPQGCRVVAPPTDSAEIAPVENAATEQSPSSFWGACGVERCDDCWPLFNDANEPITDNFGRPL